MQRLRRAVTAAEQTSFYYTENLVTLPVKGTKILVRYERNLNFLDRLSTTTNYKIFKNLRAVGVESFHA
jgi:hypothetical protein